ncbi:phage tail protein [Clostridium nigeriense]|uniref:phage tail protein n=1 Tax=Clostridium nigeriense TaxID=1805470 RepID=UPI003D32E96D
MAVKNLLIRGGADFSDMQKGLNKAQKNLSNFQSNVKSIMGKVATIFATIKIGELIKDGVKDAMSVETSIENINRTMQGSAKAFGDWVKSQSQAYGMSIQEGYKYGSTYSNLISSFQSNTKEIANSTQELMKATSIIASKTGRTFEDTAERIRSGMLGSTEAIEDLGVYTQVSMLESTEAFKQLADGKTWQQLNFQTQQQIRLAAILEQTYARYGTTLADTTQTRHNQFIASLKNVQLTLGQAFLPIYNAILPPLTIFMNALSKAISIIAQFTTALFGKPKATQEQTQAISNQSSAVSGLGDSLDDTADSADSAKKAIKSLAGFDELNVLSQDSGSSGTSGGTSGAGGGIDTSGLDLGDSGFLSSVIEVSEKIQAFTDKIKTCFNTLKEFIIKNKEAIISALAGIAATFTSYFVMSNWTTIIEGIQLAFYALGYAISGISLPILAIAAMIGILVGNIVYLWQTNEGFRNSVIEVWNNIKEFINTVVTDIGTILTSLWQEYGQTLIDNLKGFMQSIQNIIVTIWESVIKPIITNALEMLTWLWDNHLKGLVEELGKFIMKLVNGVLEIWNKFISPIVDFLVKTLGPIFVTVFNYIVDSIGTAIAVISDIVKGLLRVFGGIIDFLVGIFTLNWSKTWQGIKDIFGGIFDSLVGIAKWPLNMIIDLVNTAISGINSMIKVINKVPGVNISTVPKIPKLAKGGIVDSPTLSLIGEQGREAVMPLENNTGWITDLAEKVATRMPQGSGDNSISGDLIFQIDSSVIGKVALKQLRKMQRQGNITLIPV